MVMLSASSSLGAIKEVLYMSLLIAIFPSKLAFHSIPKKIKGHG